MIYLVIGNVVFMLGYIVGKICAAYELWNEQNKN